MSRQGFKHIGEVISVESDNVVVISLRSSSACEGCHAKGACSVSGGLSEDGSVRQMRVVSGVAGALSVGERVEVSITYRVGLLAVVVAYILPLILFILSIVVLVAVGVEQGLSALIAFVIAAVYYGVVYLNHKRFESVVHFEVAKLR